MFVYVSVYGLKGVYVLVGGCGCVVLFVFVGFEGEGTLQRYGIIFITQRSALLV